MKSHPEAFQVCSGKNLRHISKADLVVGAELLPVGCEAQQTSCSVHQTSDLQAVVAPPLTPRAAALSGPHHEAVAALYAAGHDEGVYDEAQTLSISGQYQVFHFTDLSWTFPFSSPSVTVTVRTLWSSKLGSY